jgi:hypothetical protein
MTSKIVKKLNSKKSNNTSEIQSIIKTVKKYKKGTLKTICHTEMKILLTSI